MRTRGVRESNLEESRVISNTAAYHNILCRTSVVVHNAAVQHPSLYGVSGLESDHRGVADRCVTRQQRQLHSILPPTSFFHRTISGEDVCGSASRVDQAMVVLRTDNSAVNGVEWYAQTLNDALETQ
ncbi:hypothetical protein TNCV_5075431 [Trichonephila clavipes]|uniref:Uncharacterized protein n=1 Tax=Trichonephila clavipes TaxID=2585209 RepID=A0A8X6RUY3_TRICX|nr:hypothetical protein TNCV_5075431 [Trichonephila clavipes]